MISSRVFNVYRGMKRKHVESGGGCEREEGCVFDKYTGDLMSKTCLSLRTESLFGWQNTASFYFCTQKLGKFGGLISIRAVSI